MESKNTNIYDKLIELQILLKKEASMKELCKYNYNNKIH